MKSDSQHIGVAIGRMPSGCAILTCAHEGTSSGMLVSWMQQACFEPPSITVALLAGRPILSLLERSSRFVLNVIGENPTAMFKHFGKGFSLEEDAFVGLSTEASKYGPVLTDAIAHMGCHVVSQMSVGDHLVFAATVEAGEGDIEAKPYVHIRKDGLKY